MSDNADDSGKQDAAGPRAGQRLANARRANSISMRDIAKALHVDEVKVQALEDNRFDVLGAPVFAMGYLRKYAELVNVWIDDVLADYYRMTRAVGAPPVVGPLRRKPSREFSLWPWIAGILIVGAGAAATFWWADRSPVAPGPATTRTAPVPARAPELSEPGVSPATAEPAPTDAATTPATAEPGSADTPAGQRVEPAVRPEPAADLPVPGDVQLQLRFSGDCWTEVTDSGGRRLYFGLGTSGRSVTVTGTPPLRVLLGNNDNVSVLVDGRDYAVSAAELRGNTARMTIGAP
jgi:cytoskeleton protein RodZ